MEHCPHVGNLRLDGNKTLLSPAHWSCSQCGTTESVWGCLLCSNVACGRDAGKHALDHFKQSNHPLAIEINKKYVHCYFCDAYVFNDNSHNELQLIRDTLNQLATQTYGEARTRSGRILRQASVNFAKDESRVVEESSKQADKLYTAECHCRISLLMRVFSAWQHYNKDHKCHSKSSTIAGKSTLMPPPLHLPSKMVKRRLAAGVTGLRNLGNTCYMNSALQALSHQTLFRECFRLLNVQQTVSCRRLYMRQTTMECFKEVTRPITKKKHQCRARYAQSGLKGGTEEDEESGNGREDQEVDSANREVSLCKALHAIFRVMWSGKWAMVTPHAVLSAVWSKISGFRGYSQQDTHEFLCELLCELQSELREFPDSAAVIFSEPMRNVVLPSEIISSSFEGQLMSAVVCHTCNTVSETIESFYDLSLDFPLNNSRESGDKHSTQPFSYNLTDLLQHFTMWETLDGCIYSCTYCNQKRRGSNSQFQCASKQLMLHKPPDVLRLHLKRFRWHETDRAKISMHVSFPTTLDVSPYCNLHATNETSHLTYHLTSSIMHHGKGFASGHYTAYCYNTEASSWVHCNDSRVSLCTEQEVLSSQAYILFFTRSRSMAANVQPSYSVTSPPAVDLMHPAKRVRIQ